MLNSDGLSPFQHNVVGDVSGARRNLMIKQLHGELIITINIILQVPLSMGEHGISARLRTAEKSLIKILTLP